MRRVTGSQGKLLLLLLLFSLVFTVGIRGQPAPSPELAAITAALQADPRNVNALNAYGIEQARAGDLIGAIRTWRYAIDLAPRYVHLFNNIGSALRRLGHLANAHDWYQASLRLQPTYWTWYNLGLLQEEMGKAPDAQKSYWEAIRLFPAFVQARERFLRLERLGLQGPVPPAQPSPKPPVPIMPEPAPITPPRTPPKTPPPMAIPSPVPIVRTPSPRIPPEPEAGLPEPRREPVAAAPRPTPPSPRGEELSAETEAREMAPIRLPSDSGGQVFLTFDGGSEAGGYTGILDALAAHRVRSTFFLTGQWVRTYPDLARRILAEGHEIANHSMSHKDMAAWGKEAIATELGKAETIFQQVLGHRGAPFFRFPFGAQNRRVEALTEELGYRPVYWTIDTLDWKEPSVGSIVNKVVTRIKRGAVVLMHVGSRNGSKALPAILDNIIGRGFRPARLSDLDPTQIAALPTIGG